MWMALSSQEVIQRPSNHSRIFSIHASALKTLEILNIFGHWGCIIKGGNFYFTTQVCTRRTWWCSLLGSRPYSFPMEQTLKLKPTDGKLLQDPSRYRRLVERLIYLTVKRPDITFAVHVLCRFMREPHQPHLDAALHVLHCPKEAPGQGILFPTQSNLKLRSFCDSDWASCPVTRRSVIGYCTFLGNSLISWKTKK